LRGSAWKPRQKFSNSPAQKLCELALVVCTQDYEQSLIQRYPDPSDFLPNPVAAQIFVYAQMNSALRCVQGEAFVASKKNLNPKPPSRVAEMRSELARKIAAHIDIEGDLTTAIPGLKLYRRTSPTECSSATYTPMLVIFVQGQKRVNLGKKTYLCDESKFLLTSVDLPVLSQVIAATPQKPILSLLLHLEMPVVREILSQEEFPLTNESSDTSGMAVGTTSVELLSACSRLIDLLDTPNDIPFLSSLIQREIIYRLLRGPQGRHLRAIATLGEQSHRTAKAIAWLRTNYARPLRVEELASIASMGVSTLHHHFRSLTDMSPLQYQKQLRLHVARERMLIAGLDAATAAFEVGYESPSQFNREYSRFFGQPPMRDIKSLRASSAISIT
jgi:AraC-like DNA-binding protein